MIRVISSSLALVAICAFSVTATADAIDSFQMHGFYSQGFAYSKGNRFYGDSTDGSAEYYEAALNASSRLSSNLRIAGQLLARDAGASDNGSIRTDYLFLDFRPLDSASSSAGFRIGRVKNAFGFYNDTRDVIFTRPSILLPQSAYLEGTGVREILFSSDGLQLYSDWQTDTNHTEFIVSFGRDREVSGNILSNLGSTSSQLDAELEHPLFARLLHERNNGEWRFAMSYVQTTLAFTRKPGAPTFVPNGGLASELFLASAQHNSLNWTWTSEYSLIATKFDAGGSSSSNKGEGAYLQAQYRWKPNLTTLARYDVSFSDRTRPNQTDSHAAVAGIRWEPDPQWIVSAELHGFRGRASVPNTDNAGLTPAERSELLLIMIGFRL